MTPDHEARAREIVESWLDAQSVGLIETLVDDIGPLITAIADALTQAEIKGFGEGAGIGYKAADERALVRAREEIAERRRNDSDWRAGRDYGLDVALTILDRHIAAAREPTDKSLAEAERERDSACAVADQHLQTIQAFCQELGALRERVAVLEGALEDLTASAEADYIDETTADEPDDSSVASDECGAVKTTFGMIRRARAALSGAAVEGDGWRKSDV